MTTHLRDHNHARSEALDNSWHDDGTSVISTVRHDDVTATLGVVEGHDFSTGMLVVQVSSATSELTRKLICSLQRLPKAMDTTV